MFLHVENLEMLWHALQKTPYLVEFTQRAGSPGEKELWFRTISEQFYAQWISQLGGKPPVNSRELLAMNKRALSHIIQELKRELGYWQKPATIRTDDLSPYNVAAERKQREDARSNEFNQYQSEYNRLLERPPIPTNSLPSFTGDEKITNMEELVQQHLKMRNMDLTMHSNEPTANAPTSNTNFTAKPPKLRILDSIETIDLEIGTVTSEEYPLKSQKAVHWA